MMVVQMGMQNGKPVVDKLLVPGIKKTRYDAYDAYSYSDKFAKNTIVGSQNGVTIIHTACPICAEKDFMRYALKDARQALAQGATCTYCGRTLRQTIIDLPNGGWSYEWLLIGGADVPDYLKDKVRRPEDFGVKREDMKT